MGDGESGFLRWDWVAEEITFGIVTPGDGLSMAPVFVGKIWRGGLARAVIGTAGANFVVIFANLAIGVMVARSLGDSGRGVYVAVQAWYALSLVLGEVGQSAAVTYFTAKQPHALRSIVAKARWIMFTGGALVATVGVLFADLISDGNSEFRVGLSIAFVGCGLNAFVGPYLYATQAISLRNWNICRVSQPVVMIVLVVGCWLFGGLSVVTMCLFLVSSGLVSSALAIFFCRKSSEVALPVHGLFQYGLSYSGSSIPTSITSVIDRLALSRLVSPAELGQYSVAQTVISVAAPIGTAFSSAAFPYLASGRRGDAERRSFEFLLVVVSAACVALIAVLLALAGPALIPVVFGSDFDRASQYLWWFVPVIILRCIATMQATAIRGRGRPGLAAASEVTGLIMTSLILLFSYGVLGLAAAPASLVAGQTVTIIISALMIRRIKL